MKILLLIFVTLSVVSSSKPAWAIRLCEDALFDAKRPNTTAYDAKDVLKTCLNEAEILDIAPLISALKSADKWCSALSYSDSDQNGARCRIKAGEMAEEGLYPYSRGYVEKQRDRNPGH